MKIYNGEKKPSMSDLLAKREVIPLKTLCNQVTYVKTSECTDFEFIKKALTKPCVLDFRQRKCENLVKLQNTRWGGHH